MAGGAISGELRKGIWRNPNAGWYYAQNMPIYANRECLQSRPRLKTEFESATSPRLVLIHPTRYLATADLRQVPLRRLLKVLLATFVHRVRRTLRKGKPVK